MFPDICQLYGCSLLSILDNRMMSFPYSLSLEIFVTFFYIRPKQKHLNLFSPSFRLSENRVARFFLVQNTKTGENIPNCHNKWP
jgi:hypothetical protein